MDLENCTGYLTTEGHKDIFLEEAALYKHKVVAEFDRLVILDGELNQKLVWHQNVWLNPKVAKIESINKAGSFLKSLGRNWVHYPFQSVRRGELIAKALPYLSLKPLNFGDKKPASNLGSYLLIDNDTLIYSQECTSAFKNGLVLFNEDRENPPSRAYLKLWEAFTLIDNEDILPKKGDLTLDVGSCPGGWTWVLANYGADVFSYDKAPLDERLNDRENIKFFAQSAFGLEPKQFDRPIKWFCSDIICYPPRLLNLVKKLRFWHRG